jgi:hypothetical protein
MFVTEQVSEVQARDLIRVRTGHLSVTCSELCRVSFNFDTNTVPQMSPPNICQWILFLELRVCVLQYVCWSANVFIWPWAPSIWSYLTMPGALEYDWVTSHLMCLARGWKELQSMSSLRTWVNVIEVSCLDYYKQIRKDAHKCFSARSDWCVHLSLIRVNAYKMQLKKRYSVNQELCWQCYRLWSAIFTMRLIPSC